jgi:hypothetical protein
VTGDVACTDEREAVDVAHDLDEREPSDAVRAAFERRRPDRSDAPES